MVSPAVRSHKRSSDAASVSGSSSSDEPSRKKHRKGKKNSTGKNSDEQTLNGGHRSAFKDRRNSLGKAARDPRDEPPSKRKVSISGEVVSRTRSPTPVIDFDGLSRPSKQDVHLGFYMVGRADMILTFRPWNS